MKIVRFTSENFKRLRAVEITPDGNTVIISGRNAQGKTSILDAIWAALGGGTSTKGTPRPVRDGEKSAEVTLDLGNFIVTRTWDAKTDKSTLKITSPDGARYPSPQSMLDGLVGKLSFDPLAFASMAAKDQLATLLDLVDLPFDPDKLDAERTAVFDERTDANRNAKAIKARVDALPALPDTPTEPVSVTALMDELREARETIATIDDSARNLAEHTRAANEAHDLLQSMEAKLVEQRRIAEDFTEGAVRASQEHHELTTHNPIPDVAAIEARIASADEINATVRAAQDAAKIHEEHAIAAAYAEGLTERIAKLDAVKRDGLAAAQLPIDGLGLDDDGVTYQGVPFTQASAAEQLRVSLAMAMAMNPEIRVIRITDGSLLDSANLAAIEALAAERDFQVWIEVVDETGDVGVMIEDGQVAS